METVQAVQQAAGPAATETVRTVISAQSEISSLCRSDIPSNHSHNNPAAAAALTGLATHSSEQTVEQASLTLNAHRPLLSVPTAHCHLNHPLAMFIAAYATHSPPSPTLHRAHSTNY